MQISLRRFSKKSSSAIDGTIVDVEVSAVAVEWEGSRGVQVIARDITERKRAEEALLFERMLLRTLIDNIPDSIYSKDMSCRKTLANLAEVRNLRCNMQRRKYWGRTTSSFTQRNWRKGFLLTTN